MVDFFPIIPYYERLLCDLKLTQGEIMKKCIIISLLLAALAVATFAELSRTAPSFLASAFAQANKFSEHKQNKKNVHVYVSPEKELVILKTKGNHIYYEKFTWLTGGVPEDVTARDQIMAEFLLQSCSVPADHPDREALLQFILAAFQEKKAEFPLGVFKVKNNLNGDLSKDKPFVEAFIPAL